MVKLQVTEYKSDNKRQYIEKIRRFGNIVRVFINDNFYGYWCSEDFLVNELSKEQQKKYFMGNNNYDKTHFEISVETANRIIAHSKTPYEKVYLKDE